MIISLTRRFVVCAGIVALSISLVGQTAMADERNGARHDKEVKHHKSAKRHKSAKNHKKVKHLKDLNCASGHVAKSNGAGSWSCEPDENTDTDTLAELDCMDGDIIVFDDPYWVCESELPAPPRFVDNGDGTVTDNDTGLTWEKKTGTVGDQIICSGAPCPDPHNVNNAYVWSPTLTIQNGTLYSDFLAMLNLDATNNPNATCFAYYCDWRIPNIVELQSIFPTGCPLSDPCINAVFDPTQASFYWSSSSGVRFADNAWGVYFSLDAGAIDRGKDGVGYARAVRGGQ